jgi:hypothetical protein
MHHKYQRARGASEALKFQRQAGCLPPSCAKLILRESLESDSMNELGPVKQQQQEPSIGKGLAIAGIAALIIFNPFAWVIIAFALVMALSLIAGGAGFCMYLIGKFGAWTLVVLLAASFIGPIRDRISGKHELKKLQDQLAKANERYSELQQAHMQAEQDLQYFKLIAENRK